MSQPIKSEEKYSRRRQIIRSYKSRADAKRTMWERLADLMTARFGSVIFLVTNALWFLLWIILNVNVFGNEPFDPYPFGFLTMVVSLEAIFLAIIVLISQNRAAHIADMREEIELQVSITAEEEITKIMSMLSMLLEKHGIDISNDPELVRMLKPMANHEIEERIEKELC